MIFVTETQNENGSPKTGNPLLTLLLNVVEILCPDLRTSLKDFVT